MKLSVSRRLGAGVCVLGLLAAQAGCGGGDGSAGTTEETSLGIGASTGGVGGAGGSTAAAGGNGGTGGMGNPELDAACTPTFTLDLQDMGPGGQLFLDSVPDPEAFVQDIGRRVCRILYRNASEVRAANHITLIIKQDPIPGWKSGDVGDITVMISTTHLADVQAQGNDVATEIEGVLFHEMTHMYQNDDKAPGEGTYANLPNVIEGVADAVRIRGMLPPIGAKPSKTGTWDDQGYWKPAFFLLWIDNQFPDFLYHLNLSMIAGDGVVWAPDQIGTITGKSADMLWTEYQGATCCLDTQQACCH